MTVPPGELRPCGARGELVGKRTLLGELTLRCRWSSPWWSKNRDSAKQSDCLPLFYLRTHNHTQQP